MEYCGCIPWDYNPTEHNRQKDTKICDFFGTSCFKSFLRNGLADTCKETCTADCNKVAYTASVEKEALDWEKLCSYEHNSKMSTSGLFELKVVERIRNITHLENAGIIKFQEALMESGDTNKFLTSYCRAKMRYDVAIVDIIMASPEAEKYVQALKVNFTDKVANLGKVIVL